MFRVEVLDRQHSPLAGDVLITMPVSWQVIGYFLFVNTVFAMTYLSLANYSHTVTVAGELVPSAGISVIIPTRTGVVESVPVHDGQEVAAGTELVLIRAEEDSVSGIPAAARVESAIAWQDASLSAQIEATLSSTQAQLGQLATQHFGLKSEIGHLQSQVGLQRNLVASAQKDLDRARSIADRGFISGRDLQIREDALLSRQQGLSQLTQALAAKQSALEEGERSAGQIAAQSRAQRASLAASRAQVAQQAATAAGSRSYVLRAPVIGRLTALSARVGQTVNEQSVLMMIVPVGSTLQAQLAVPSSAIGFVRAGQEVRLAIDAFPYQRFGTVAGKVLTIATSSVSVRSPSGATASVYPMTVRLDRTTISAYGRNESLVSGMTVTARIVTQKQSLLEWLFEPLFAVQRR